MTEQSRIVFSSDIHGNIEQYRSLVELANNEEANTLIIGGDLFPKKNKREGSKKTVSVQVEYFEETLLPILREFKGHTYITFGNADFYVTIPQFRAIVEREQNIHVAHSEIITLHGTKTRCLFYAGVPFSRHHSKDFERFDKEDPDDHQLIMRRGDVSLSGTTSLTPEILRSDFNITESALKPGSREDLENHGPGISRVTFPSSTNFIKKFCIENEMKKILANSSERMIWVTHGPPFGTMNDMLKAKKHVGSSAIRELILKHQPLMTLHGHIHETVDVNKGKFMDTLGKTCCFSSGNAPQKKFVAAVIVDLDNVASARRVLK